MKTCKLILLHEVSKKTGQDQLEERQCLVNAEGIVTVFESELETGDITIIGAQKVDPKLRAILLINGRSVYVKESLDEILAKCLPK